MGKIVWIASYPKSGNTWMRMFLMQYFTGRQELEPNAAQQFAPNENSPRFYQPFLKTDARLLPDSTLAAVRPQVQRAIAASTNSYILLKTHHLWGVHHGTPTVSVADTAASVYIVRNPLDVAVSYAAFRNVSYDQAIDWLLEEDRIIPRMPGGSYFFGGSWSQNVRSWRLQRQVPCTFLKYEDLLADPRQHFERLLISWQLQVNQTRFSEALDATSLKSLQKAEDLRGFMEKPAQTERFFRSGKSGEGNEKLTLGQQQRILDACGEEMAACGYATSGESP